MYILIGLDHIDSKFEQSHFLGIIQFRHDVVKSLFHNSGIVVTNCKYNLTESSAKES